MQENTDQKKLRIWTLFTQWLHAKDDTFKPVNIDFLSLKEITNFWYVTYVVLIWYQYGPNQN